LGFSAKLYPKVLGLAATPDLKIIFIITLNLHDPNLSESGYNTGLIITLNKNFGCGSDYKVVS
jgi:3-isopropylmalate dehydratase small subunit